MLDNVVEGVKDLTCHICEERFELDSEDND